MRLQRAGRTGPGVDRDHLIGVRGQRCLIRGQNVPGLRVDTRDGLLKRKLVIQCQDVNLKGMQIHVNAFVGVHIVRVGIERDSNHLCTTYKHESVNQSLEFCPSRLLSFRVMYMYVLWATTVLPIGK